MSDDIEFVEPRVGVLAARTFRVWDGKFHSPFRSMTWHGATMAARCWRKQQREVLQEKYPQLGTDSFYDDHEPPGDNCGCGIYSFVTVQEVFRQYGPNASRCVAVIAPEGISLEGELGWRTPRATILAAFIADGDAVERPKVNATYPDVRIYDDLAAMLADYPAVDDGTGIEGCQFQESWETVWIHVAGLIQPMQGLAQSLNAAQITVHALTNALQQQQASITAPGTITPSVPTSTAPKLRRKPEPEPFWTRAKNGKRWTR